MLNGFLDQKNMVLNDGVKRLKLRVQDRARKIYVYLRLEITSFGGFGKLDPHDHCDFESMACRLKHLKTVFNIYFVCFNTNFTNWQHA